MTDRKAGGPRLVGPPVEIKPEPYKAGPRCVQLGCGSHRPAGWESYDAEIDISQALPFGDGSIDRLLCEHTIEHVTQQQGIAFLAECKRVLRAGGVLRVSFPAPRLYSREYAQFVAERTGQPPSLGACLRFVMFGSGHVAIWTPELLQWVGVAQGWAAARVEYYGESNVPEFQGIDGHHHEVGEEVAEAETATVELQKGNA